ncbi:MAG: hypothetical protein Q4G59_05580 [Planctomycetia bacterium]|nr:hypothetical protein [Planctomycetia bacterium]
MPELIPFEIKVTQDNKPLEGAYVSLKGEKIAYLVDGVTDSNGVATLMTQGKFRGAPADQYKVAISKRVETPSKFQSSPPDDETLLAQWEKDRASEYRPTHNYIEKKYGDTATSGFTVSIAAKGTFVFDVGKAVDEITIPKGTSPTPK